MSAYFAAFVAFRRAGALRTAFLVAALRTAFFRDTAVRARFFAAPLAPTRSGSALLPVERFHSSYCSSVILPSTRSCANFRR